MKEKRRLRRGGARRRLLLLERAVGRVTPGWTLPRCCQYQETAKECRGAAGERADHACRLGDDSAEEVRSVQAGRARTESVVSEPEGIPGG
jgi:hypothetical protein